MMAPLKYLCNLWKTLEMPLINCEINLMLTWSQTCIISDAAANQETTTNLCSILTLSTHDDVK